MNNMKTFTINTMDETKYKALQKQGKLSPNQLYIVDDDSKNRLVIPSFDMLLNNRTHIDELQKMIYDKTDITLEYSSDDKKLKLVNKNVVLGEIETDDFIKDGMLSSAEWDSENKIIKLAFNTDAGCEEISVDLFQSITSIENDISEISDAVALSVFTINNDLTAISANTALSVDEISSIVVISVNNILNTVQLSVDGIEKQISDIRTDVETMSNHIALSVDTISNHIALSVDEISNITKISVENICSKIEDVSEKIDQEISDMVKFSHFDWNDEEYPKRKTIQLDNYDSVSGKLKNGSAANLAMVSKWDVADFGSSQLPMNLNSKTDVTVNDRAKVLTDYGISNYISSENISISQIQTENGIVQLLNVSELSDIQISVDKISTDVALSADSLYSEISTIQLNYLTKETFDAISATIGLDAATADNKVLTLSDLNGVKLSVDEISSAVALSVNQMSSDIDSNIEELNAKAEYIISELNTSAEVLVGKIKELSDYAFDIETSCFGISSATSAKFGEITKKIDDNHEELKNRITGETSIRTGEISYLSGQIDAINNNALPNVFDQSKTYIDTALTGYLLKTDVKSDVTQENKLITENDIREFDKIMHLVNIIDEKPEPISSNTYTAWGDNRYKVGDVIISKNTGKEFVFISSDAGAGTIYKWEVIGDQNTYVTKANYDDFTKNMEWRIENMSSNLDVAQSQTLKFIKQENGVITVEAQEIEIKQNQIEDLSGKTFVETKNAENSTENDKLVKSSTVESKIQDELNALSMSEIQVGPGKTLQSIKQENGAVSTTAIDITIDQTHVTGLSENISSLSNSISCKVKVGNYGEELSCVNELSIVHIDRDEYYRMTKLRQLDQKTIYILSGNSLNAYGMPIKNVGSPSSECDAVNLSTLTVLSGDLTNKINDEVKEFADELYTTIHPILSNVTTDSLDLGALADAVLQIYHALSGYVNK